ncbi:MAG: hypothetical protein ACRYG5_02105 [Janthinobacterium lividum]
MRPPGGGDEPGDLYFSLAGFIFFYTGLLIVEMFLMLRYARRGPDLPSTERVPREPPTTQKPPSLTPLEPV